MRAFLWVVLVCCLALGLIGGAVFGVNDKETFVAPPEAVVEGFVRALVSGRYSRAVPHLSQSAAATTSEAELRNFANEIKTSVKVLEVKGEPVALEGENAQAVAIVRTTSGERRVAFLLVREDGVWSIEKFESIDGSKSR
jgi:hypothetical protein